MQKFNVFDAQVEFDDTDPEGYRGGMNRFGPKIGGARMGATLYELPPGQALCPYHYESEEEWLLVSTHDPAVPWGYATGAPEAITLNENRPRVEV